MKEVLVGVGLVALAAGGCTLKNRVEIGRENPGEIRNSLGMRLVYIPPEK